MVLIAVGSAAAALQTSETGSSWRLRSRIKKKKKKNRILSTSASPPWMSNQLHDSEGGPLFKINHCNLIMCGLIKAKRLADLAPIRNPPREEEGRKEGAQLPPFLHTATPPPPHLGLAAYQVSADWGVVETLATLRLSASARCSRTKAASGTQLDGPAFHRRCQRLLSVAVQSGRRQGDCNHFQSLIYLLVCGWSLFWWPPLLLQQLSVCFIFSLLCIWVAAVLTNCHGPGTAG